MMAKSVLTTIHVVREHEEAHWSVDYDGNAICGKTVTPVMEVATIAELKDYPINHSFERLCLTCKHTKWFGMALLEQL